MSYLPTLFCINTITCSLMVTTTTTTTRGTIWLILSYINGCGILIILNLEFIALLMIIIYVGAIGILFLFIIMMIDSTESENNSNIYSTTTLSIILISSIWIQIFNSNIAQNNWINLIHNNYFNNESSIELIGNNLYTQTSQWFLLSGIILLTTMIIATILIQNSNT